MTLDSMKRREFLILCATLPAAMESVALAAPDQLADYLEGLVKQAIAPGAALVASRRGSVKFKKAFGTCCRIDGRAAPLTLNTIHPFYSSEERRGVPFRNDQFTEAVRQDRGGSQQGY